MPVDAIVRALVGKHVSVLVTSHRAENTVCAAGWVAMLGMTTFLWKRETVVALSGCDSLLHGVACFDVFIVAFAASTKQHE